MKRWLLNALDELAEVNPLFWVLLIALIFFVFVALV